MAQIFFFILPNGGLVVEKPYTVKGFKKTLPIWRGLKLIFGSVWSRVAVTTLLLL